MHKHASIIVKKVFPVVTFIIYNIALFNNIDIMPAHAHIGAVINICMYT